MGPFSHSMRASPPLRAFAADFRGGLVPRGGVYAAMPGESAKLEGTLEALTVRNTERAR